MVPDALLQGTTGRKLLIYYGLGTPLLYFFFRRPASSLKSMALQASVRVLSLPLFVVIAYTGSTVLLSEDTSLSGEMGRSKRLFGSSPSSRWLTSLFVWHLAIEVVLKILCQALESTRRFDEIVQYCHHLSAVALGLHVLSYNFIEYYYASMAGITEISSIPLQLMSFFKMSKTLADRFPNSNKICRAAFAVSFLLCRIVLSAGVGVLYLSDMSTLLLSHNPADLNGVPLWHVYLLLLVNAGLMGLQLFWANKIVCAMWQSFKSGKRGNVD